MVKSFIKSFAPAALLKYRQRKLTGISGDFLSWEEAKAIAGSYMPNIAKVVEIHRKYRNNQPSPLHEGELHERIWAWPLLSGLLLSAIQSGGRLHVLDFGGGLGTTYFQLTSFLSPIQDLKWCIVEIEALAEAGKRQFEDNVLKFYDSPESVFKAYSPDVLVSGSVWQYIENPYDTLRKLLQNTFNYVFIDRIPLFPGMSEKVMIQQSPERLGGSRHPIRILSEEKFHAILTPHFELIGSKTWGPYPYSDSKADLKCLLFRRNREVT